MMSQPIEFFFMYKDFVKEGVTSDMIPMGMGGNSKTRTYNEWLYV